MTPEQIKVAGDFAGLRIAAKQLLMEELFAEDDASQFAMLDTAANAQRLLAGIKPRRTISPGYYDRAVFLFELEERIESHLVAAKTLTADEVTGLRAVKLGRGDFLREHPRCARCGQCQKDKSAAKCQGCGAEFDHARAS